MTIYIKDPKTDKAVRKLAKMRGISLTEAIHVAVQKELEAEQATDIDEAAVDAIIAKVAAWPKTGLKADKAFFDSLYED